MALSKNFELGNFASGLDVNNSTGAITNINLNTDAITEGSNLYYTDTRVNTFAGGGSLATITTSGDVTVGGNLIVNGSTTTINSTTLDVDDLNITVAKGSANASAANGAGLTIDGANATFTYVSASDRFAMNKSLATDLVGNVTGTVSDISNHLLDEDNFATDSATKAPSQQSVKAYVTSQLSTQDNTDELTEGSTNLFFTNERVDDRVNALIVGGSNITATYDDAAGTLTIAGAAGYTTSSFNTDLAAKTTDNITEGSSNLYHTNSRADARIAAANIGALSDVTVSSVASGQVLKWNGSAWVNQADAGGIALTNLSVGSESSASGNGAIAYNNSTGVFTYTPPILNGLTATGTTDFGSNKITYSNHYAQVSDLPSASTYHGMFAHVHATNKGYFAHGGNWIKLLDETSSTTADLTEGSNLYYTDARVQTYLGGGSATNILTSGNITVGGNLTVNGTTTTISTTNTVVEDALIELGTGTSGTPANDSGIVIERGSEANAFIGFDESADKFVVGTGTFTGASTGNLTITTGTLLANVEGNVTGNVTGTVSSLSNLTSDNLGEGSSNLYYTTARHNSDFDTRLGTKDTGSLSEGSNLYYTDARVKASTLTAGSLRGSVNNATVQYGTSYTGTPAQGSFFFDSLNSKLKVYTGSAFVDAVPAGGGGGGGGASDANTTFRNHTYDVASTTNALSGKDSIIVTAGAFVIGYKYEIISAGNTSFTGIGSANNNVGTQFTATGAGTGTGTAGHVLNYTTTGNQNIVVFRNGVKQVEGSSDDYVASSGTSINFTYNLLSGDIIDVQIYELLTNSAYYLKTETYTQAQVNSQISTGVSSYLPLAGGTMTGNIAHASDFTIDSGGNITLDADGGHVFLKDDGSEYARFTQVGGGLRIQTVAQDADIVLRGNDNGGDVDALTLDMSDAGTAIFNHDAKFADNNKAIFGASSDLQIYHDTQYNHSIIEETGSGNLTLRGDNLFLTRKGSGDNYLGAVADGAVTLYYDGLPKIATTSTGVDVTGTLTASVSIRSTDFAEIRADDAEIYLTNAANNRYFRMKRDGSDIDFDIFNGSSTSTAITIKENRNINLGVGSDLNLDSNLGANSTTAYTSMDGRIFFSNDYSNTPLGANKIVLQNDGNWNSGFGISNNSLDIYTGGDINFHKSNSTSSWTRNITFKGDGKVGIGTASPGYKLQVDHGTSAQYASSIRNTSDNLQLLLGTTTGGLLNIQGKTISSNATYAIALQAEGGNVGIGSASPSSKLDISSIPSDAYSAGGFNEKPAITIKTANANTNYGAIRFTNTSGNFEHFFGSVQTSSNTADMVFQGYDRTGGTYKEYLRLKDSGNIEMIGNIFHREIGNNGDMTFPICSISNQGSGGGQYLHAQFQLHGGAMFHIHFKGYDYTANIKNGSGGGYIYNTAGQATAYSRAFSGDCVEVYQNIQNRVELVINTGGSATGNRWGSMLFFGGTDTITSNCPISLVQYTWNGTTARQY